MYVRTLRIKRRGLFPEHKVSRPAADKVLRRPIDSDFGALIGSTLVKTRRSEMSTWDDILPIEYHWCAMYSIGRGRHPLGEKSRTDVRVACWHDATPAQFICGAYLLNVSVGEAIDKQAANFGAQEEQCEGTLEPNLPR